PRPWPSEAPASLALPLGELGRALVELLARHDPALGQNSFRAVEPMLVIGRGEIFRRRHLLDRMADLVDVDLRRAHREIEHPEEAPLPILVKDRLILFPLDRPEAVHAAEVVYPVHRMPSRSSPHVAEITPGPWECRCRSWNRG